MTSGSDLRLALIAFGLWISVIAVGFPADAQQGPPPAPEEPLAAGVSPELAEIERKTDEVRSRLEEWKAKALEYLLAGQEAQARAQAIDEEITRLQHRDAVAIPLDANAS